MTTIEKELKQYNIYHKLEQYKNYGKNRKNLTHDKKKSWLIIYINIMIRWMNQK